jgi:hypothetical protein
MCVYVCVEECVLAFVLLPQFQEQTGDEAGQGLGRAGSWGWLRCPGNGPRRKLAQASDSTIATLHKALAYLHPSPIQLALLREGA